MFEEYETPDSRDDVTQYLTAYSNKPLTKSEMIDNIALSAMKEFDMSKLFQIKRMGKDRDPLFWSFGKIHGLENIAFADPAELRATNGNPVKIQRLVDKVEGYPDIHSFEQLVADMQKSLADYKASVDAIPMNPSDRKKILALPFYLAKRSQNPEPRLGQHEFELFKELTGSNWYDDARVIRDEEHKITEFDYENFIDTSLLTKEFM